MFRSMQRLNEERFPGRKRAYQGHEWHTRPWGSAVVFVGRVVWQFAGFGACWSSDNCLLREESTAECEPRLLHRGLVQEHIHDGANARKGRVIPEGGVGGGGVARDGNGELSPSLRCACMNGISVRDVSEAVYAVLQSERRLWRSPVDRE